MKLEQMSIKELAALLGVSTDTIRRAARSNIIPSSRKGTAYRFDWEKVRRVMRARAQELPSRRSKVTGAPGGESRPRAKRIAPDVVTRGHLPHTSLQEVYLFDEFTIHAHH